MVASGDPLGQASHASPLLPAKKVVKRRWKRKRESDAPGRHTSENRKHRGDSQGNKFKAGKGKKMKTRAYGVSIL